MEDDVELQAAIRDAHEAEEGFRAAEQALLQAETNVRNQHIKIEQTEADLYSAKVHSPKELQDLQNDVASLKRYRETLEDSQLEAMIACEKAENAHKSTQDSLQTLKGRLAEQNQDLDQEQGQLTKEIEKLSTERNATSVAIPADTIHLYEQLRTQKRGLAIATISENSCDACGSTLSLAQVQTARSSAQMAQCPSCGRILYGS